MINNRLFWLAFLGSRIKENQSSSKPHLSKLPVTNNRLFWLAITGSRIKENRFQSSPKPHLSKVPVTNNPLALLALIGVDHEEQVPVFSSLLKVDNRMIICHRDYSKVLYLKTLYFKVNPIQSPYFL